MHKLDGRAGVKGMRLSIDPVGKTRVVELEVEDANGKVYEEGEVVGGKERKGKGREG